MDFTAISLELGVVALGLAVLLCDLWTPADQKRNLGYVAAFGVALVFLCSFQLDVSEARRVFNDTYVLDGLALFFKRFFLLAGLLVLVMAVEFADQFRSGVAEYYALILFALLGMMLAASANDFALLFVSLELITVTFYVLTGFQRTRLSSLEAGVKYLILGALSSGFLVYGIALVYGSTGSTGFETLSAKATLLGGQKVLLTGLLLVFVGLGFKIAAFPFQIWVPDVYQGAPTPTTALLAVGSKAAGVVLLLRLCYGVIPGLVARWDILLMSLAAVTILYGSLCAIPQRNLKRLLGYSSIANAGYLLLGIAVLSPAGVSAVLYYLGAYLFSVLAAFAVICAVLRTVEAEDVGGLAGLHQRSPLLAAALAMAMISLAGVPPLAGFFGKFLVLRAVVQQVESNPAYAWVLAAALAGVVISLYYYFGVIRAIYWPAEIRDQSKLAVSPPFRASLWCCLAGMVVLGLFPEPLVRAAEEAARMLR